MLSSIDCLRNMNLYIILTRIQVYGISDVKRKDFPDQFNVCRHTYKQTNSYTDRQTDYSVWTLYVHRKLVEQSSTSFTPVHNICTSLLCCMMEDCNINLGMPHKSSQSSVCYTTNRRAVVVGIVRRTLIKNFFTRCKTITARGLFRRVQFSPSFSNSCRLGMFVPEDSK